MDQPEGYIELGKNDKVCKLVKSLYGLRQGPRQWHVKFDKVVISNGFKINESEKCIYYKVSDDACMIICLYVDDLLIFGTDVRVVKDTKNFLSQNFDMKCNAHGIGVSPTLPRNRFGLWYIKLNHTQTNVKAF